MAAREPEVSSGLATVQVLGMLEKGGLTCGIIIA
jgi:hypothetical protein